MTLQSPIFRKLLASAFLLIAVTIVLLDFYLTRYAARQQIDIVEERLAAQARILAGELANEPAGQLQEWAKQADERAQARVTFIDPKGVVRAESQGNPETMENHAGRPEVQAARRYGVGSSIRRSATIHRDLCYLGLVVAYQGEEGYVLRLAVPLEDLDAATAAVRLRILGASLAAAALALGMAYIFSRSFTRRISRLQAFAGGLVEAGFSASLPPGAELPPALAHSRDELGALAASLQRMGGQLRELVERLGEESARREAILASMVEGVLAVDEDLRVLFSNRSFARAIGADARPLEGMPLLELVRDTGLLEILKRVQVSRQPLSERLQLSAAEGRAFEVQAAPLESSRRGAIAILHDITELERLERVRRDFVANVSHELRTPLTAIRGYTETLLEGALEDKDHNRKFLEIIQAHAVRLDNIASDLLTLSELEAAAPPMEMERISVRAALEAALRTVEAEASPRGVRLLPGALEDVDVLGHRGRFEQALINLLDNAVKFNRPQGEVHVEARHDADGKARVVIRDTGLGIPSQDLPRIFERFYRVDKARSRDVGGTGLGLSIVKHIIERMEGRVMVESQFGKGSTFTVLLPAC